MISYSKLAVVLFRLYGIYMTFAALFGFAYAFAAPIFLSDSAGPMEWNSAYLMSSSIGVPGGVLLYYIAKPLGHFVGRGLD